MGCDSTKSTRNTHQIDGHIDPLWTVALTHSQSDLGRTGHKGEREEEGTTHSHSSLLGIDRSGSGRREAEGRRSVRGRQGE